MSYTVLARRYRSRSFDEVVGQEAISRTLQNAIKANRVAHAYLFCGTRGVGKTSMARIFAKALNCPDGKPADVVDAIMQGRDIDVIEIDGASNNKVEEARELIANSIYRPMRGPYKIYIIDEVHMLSTAAFNALLKTMEEPPEHVKFILCTTEPQKVLATIQSRCQRFDFRAIPTSRIMEHLQEVVKAEGLKADPELLQLVARIGNGSMRDALSLLDRLIASGEPRLTVRLLEDLLGLPEREVLGSLLDAIADGNVAASLELTGGLLSRGIAAEQMLESLADRLRDLLVITACGQATTLVDLSDEARTAEAARASRYDEAGLVHMIALCESAQRTVRTSAAPRAMLEAAIVRLALTDKLADVAALVLGAPTRAAPPRAAPDGTPAKKARRGS